MTSPRHKSFLSSRLPLVLSAVLVVGLAGFLLLKYFDQKKPKPVIDLSQEIIKNTDEVNKIQEDGPGGVKREKIQVRFFWEIDGFKYNDAIYFTPDEYSKLTPEKLDSLKQQRLTNWANIVNEGSVREGE